MSSILKELKDYGIRPKKILGQHFIIERNIFNKIVQVAKIEKEDTVLEIGPGLGEMTIELSKKAKKVIAVEIDFNLIEILKRKFSEYSNIELIKGDILQLDFLSLIKNEAKPLKVVANLPYQISTLLIFRFIEIRDFISELTLMVQKEVAQRIVSLPGSKDYGPLAIFVQMVSNPSIKFFIKKTIFFPPPKVESAVIQIVWRKEPLVKPEDEKWFKEVVKLVFNYRRKTLINALKSSKIPLPIDLNEKMRQANLDPQRRPETMRIEEFVKLAKILKS